MFFCNRNKLVYLICGLAFLGCSKQKYLTVNKAKHVNQSSIIGLYEFKADSTLNENPKFSESVELKNDSTFLYKYKFGSFINIEISGTWKNTLTNLELNNYHKKETLIKIDCPESHSGYFFDVKDLDGQLFNYSLIINKNEDWTRELYGVSIIDHNIKINSLQIVSSSGLHSQEFSIETLNHFVMN